MMDQTLQRIIEQALSQAKVGQYIVLNIIEGSIPHVSIFDHMKPLDLPTNNLEEKK